LTLSFANPTRDYDERRGMIRFLGYDGFSCVQFLLPVSAFHGSGGHAEWHTQDYLMAFDRLRGRILEIARASYGRTHRPTIELDLRAIGSSLQTAS
jgi:hypothetical protein